MSTVVFTHRLLTTTILGSVQNVDGIPDDIKAIFRTAFELNPRHLIDMAVARSPFIDQSQSFTLFVANPTSSLLVSDLIPGTSTSFDAIL